MLPRMGMPSIWEASLRRLRFCWAHPIPTSRPAAAHANPETIRVTGLLLSPEANFGGAAGRFAADAGATFPTLLAAASILRANSGYMVAAPPSEASRGILYFS